MKNNKGFSVLELVVSFSLTVAIVAILFELVIVMKNLYDKNNIKTQLISNQNLLTDLIYSDLNDKGLTGVGLSNHDNVNSLTFTFNDGTQKSLEWGYGITYKEETGLEKNISATISYGDYVATYPAKTSFADSSDGYTFTGNVVGVKKEYYYYHDNGYEYYKYEIPIYNSLFKNENFGLNIVFFNSANDMNDIYDANT